MTLHLADVYLSQKYKVMVTHASSHGLAVLTCTISAALLVETIKPMMPSLYKLMSGLSVNIAGWFSKPLNPEVITIALLASLFAGIWGMVFKLFIKGRD